MFYWCIGNIETGDLKHYLIFYRKPVQKVKNGRVRKTTSCNHLCQINLDTLKFYIIFASNIAKEGIAIVKSAASRH